MPWVWGPRIETVIVETALALEPDRGQIILYPGCSEPAAKIAQRVKPPSKPPATKPEVPSQLDSPSREASKNQDVVLVQGLTPDREGLVVIRARDQRLEMGEVRPVKEGQSITSDLVRLKPRPAAPFICDVETEYSPQRPSPTAAAAGAKKAGPAQVASQAYRDNWDAIWSRAAVTAPGSSELN